MNAIFLNKRSALAGALFCFLGPLSFAQVRVPRLVGDGMVLQRDKPIRVWGWASPGQAVTVRFEGEKEEAVTSAEGRWVVILSPKKAGGPYNMDIDAINHIGLRNVFVGDVWVCSGQSNMELTMERVKEKYPDIIAHADNPMIRQFRLPIRYDFNERRDDIVSGHWEAATSASVLSFSAVGYFFAKALYERDKVPVGLIVNAVGGSPAEAWLSAEALRSFPEQEAIAARYARAGYIDSVTAAERARDENWYRHVRAADKGFQEEKPWYDPAYDVSGWSSMDLPGFWADKGLPGVNGVVWFRKEIDVPAAMTGVPAKLLLGRIVDRDSVFVNGVFSGTIGYQYPPRRYELPAGVLHAGKNVIVVRVINSAGRGGFAPDKPYQVTAAGQTIDLKGSWKYRVGMTTGPLAGQTFFQYQPLGLFNAMIAPLLPYTIKGVIWYQGEANTSRAAEYRKLFPAMIEDWRRNWGEGNFPFLFVQLPNFGMVRPQPSESGWAELREAQRLALAEPKTGMAVAIDIGEWNDLHPLDKEDVGKRLALAAWHVADGRIHFVWTGPVYHSMKAHNDKIRIRFDHIENGLIVKGGGELHGFAIAGADNKFVWAKAIIDKDEVIVWSDAVAQPVAVRYAWADNPQGANLSNRGFYETETLPASPFEGRVKDK